MIIALVCLLVLLLGPAACLALIYRVWQRRRQAALALKLLAALLVAGLTSGMLGILIGIIKAFGAVGGQSIDPSQKARILAEGISEAMNSAAAGAIVLIPCAIVFAILLRKSQDTISTS